MRVRRGAPLSALASASALSVRAGIPRARRRVVRGRWSRGLAFTSPRSLCAGAVQRDDLTHQYAQNQHEAAMTIRTVRREDAAAIAAIYAPIVLESSISFEWVPPTAADFRS